MLKSALLCTALACGSLVAAELEKEPALVDGKRVPLTSKAEIAIGARQDAEIKTRELWYRMRGAGGWGSWDKHPIDFGRNTPITWQPPEGHWQVYIRLVEVSGAANPEPDARTSTDQEFIVDRSGPTVALKTPSDAEILSTGAPFTIRWHVDDPNLHSQPVSLFWARGDMAEPELIAAGLPNSGSYEWTTPLDMSNQGRLIITAHDKILNSSTAEARNIIIDGAPPQRSILGPANSRSRQVQVQTRVTDAGPARQVASAQLWYSVDAGENWTPGPQVADGTFETIPWTAPNDGEYALALVASDIAGNANPNPIAARDVLTTILIDTAAPVITLASPIGIRDAQPREDGSLRRIYKPGDQVIVDFSIQDMRLADEPVAIAFQTAPKAPWQALGANLSATQGFSFTMPDVNSTTCRIKITAVDAAGNLGEVTSKEAFTIDNEVQQGDVILDL